MDDSVIDDIFALEDQRFRAMVNQDTHTLESLLAEDLHYVHANGMIEDKAEFIRKISSGERYYREFSATSREARRDGAFTFVFGEANVEVDRLAGRLKNKLSYTAIYRDGPGPRFVVWHAVKTIDS